MVCGGGCLSSHSIPYRPEYLVLYRPVGLSSLWRPDGKIHISHYPPFRLAVFALAAHKKGVFLPHRAGIPLQKEHKKAATAAFLCVVVFWSSVLCYGYWFSLTATAALRLCFGFWLGFGWLGFGSSCLLLLLCLATYHRHDYHLIAIGSK